MKNNNNKRLLSFQCRSDDLVSEVWVRHQPLVTESNRASDWLCTV